MDRNVLLLKEMIRYYARDPKRIQHFIKVHDFAGMIGKLEGLEDDEQNILATMNEVDGQFYLIKYGQEAAELTKLSDVPTVKAVEE